MICGTFNALFLLLLKCHIHVMWVVFSISAQQYIVQLMHLKKPSEMVLRLTY